MVKTRNEEKEILKYLINHKEEKFSINQLAHARKINYKSAYQNIQKLEKRGIITTEKLGNTTLCSFNYQFDPLVFQAEWERRIDAKKNRVINSICRELKEVKSPYFIALLFGSYAKGKEHKHSDVDLLIVVDEENVSERVKTKLSLLPFDIHRVEFTTKEFMSMANSKEFSVIEEVKKTNFILFGIENYYHLIKNVRH